MRRSFFLVPFLWLCCALAAAQPVPISIGNTSGAASPGFYAADGNTETLWNSGGPPTQWIDIDLGYDRAISRLRMLTAQLPAGNTVHNLYGRTEAGQWYYFGVWGGYTTDSQWLQMDTGDSMAPVRYLVLQTTQGPSWVAWREFEAWDGGTMQDSCFSNTPQGWVVVRSVQDSGACPQTQEHIRFTWRYIGGQPSGVVVKTCTTATMGPGWSIVNSTRDVSQCIGFQNSANGQPLDNVIWIQRN